MDRNELKGQWDAALFFRDLTKRNLLARNNGFKFCQCSGLEGFEQALNEMLYSTAFICVSDSSDGYMEINNTPHSRRVKTIFMAMRHAAENMQARAQCMETMREIFRQFMSRLIPEKTRLEENHIYLDSRIAFTEIDRYFFSGCACAYFQIAVDIYTDLRYNADEWDR